MKKLLSKNSMRLTVTARAIAELGLVYHNPLDALKELIQNAVDAGATRMRITYDDVNKVLIFEHNGEPIEGEYLKAFLTVGTDFKVKRGGKYIGMFGIGRLSWIMLGDEAEIITGSKRLVWRKENIDEIEVHELGAYFSGVRWVIKLRKDLDLSVRKIKEYVQENYFGEVPIYVNDELVTTAVNNEVLFDDGLNKVFFEPRHPYSAVIVKGIFRVDTFYGMSSVVIITNDPRVEINPARGVVYTSRFTEWKKYIAESVLENIRRRYSAHEAVRKFGERFFTEPTTDLFIKPRNPLRYVPLKTVDGDYVWGDEVDPKHWAYTDVELDDTSVTKLRKQGWRVFVVNDTLLLDLVKRAGFKHAKDVILAEEAKVIPSSMTKKLREAYETAVTILRSVASALNIGRGWGKRGEETVMVRWEGASVRIVVRDAKGRVNITRVKITGKVEGTDVLLAEHEDEDVAAFTDGERIYLNVRNELVQKILVALKRTRSAKKAMLLLGPLILHELIHKEYGYDHGDPEFQKLYERAIIELLLRYVAK